MNEDKYFEKQTQRILESIDLLEICNAAYIKDVEKAKDSAKQAIYIILKEVARDQRYASIEACKAGFKNLDLYSDKITGLIQNAMIGDK